MSPARKTTLCAMPVVVLLLVCGWWFGWFSSEPTCRGKTVTQWLDQLVAYRAVEWTNAAGDLYGRIDPRPASALTNDPAFLALMKLGARAVPVLVERVKDPAGWPPEVGVGSRVRMWVDWRWKQLRRVKPANRPAPRGFSAFQVERKTKAGFILLALGTSAGAGFPAYAQAYADAPKHQSVYGTKIPGPPVGAKSDTVVSLGENLLPERREEILDGILRGMGHTSHWHRVVAAEVTWQFPREFARFKAALLKLTGDPDPIVQATAFGRLESMFHRNDVKVVLSPLELERAADAVLQNSNTTPHVRDYAERARQSARGAAKP